MLVHLTIKNYALIRHLEMEPSARLNVITGETGAGKSIMLGALGLLLGNRADTKVLFNESEKCITEGLFDISGYDLKPIFDAEQLDYAPQTILRREIIPGGKSRAFVNDTPVTLEVIRKIGYRLMDIHSQHETLELGEQHFQLKLIDSYAGNESLLKSYQDAWREYKKAEETLTGLEEESDRLKKESDFVTFQLNELLNASLKEGEDSILEAEIKVSENAELIKSKLNSLIAILNDSEYSIKHSFAEARMLINAIASFSPAFHSIQERLDSLRLDLDDIISEIGKEEEKVNFDPDRNQILQQRLDLIYQLQTKHRVHTVADLLKIQDELQHQVDKTYLLDDNLSEARKNVSAAVEKRNELAIRLSGNRKKVFDPIEKQVIKLLRELGIPDAQIIIENKDEDAGPTGTDRVNILFSANKGVKPKPLSEAASGGEFSRLMFVIKFIMAEKTAMPTLIMDEIDSGVSGDIALRLGTLMKEMAKKHQLITISHLPQIAAKATAHYIVFKETLENRTTSQIRLLNENERIEEVAKMISGAKPSSSALENARELIAESPK